MKNKSMEQFKALDNDALNARLLEVKAEYKALKFDHAVRGISNPLQIRNLRRDIARINTEFRSRQSN